MYIGLYSELARQSIVHSRDYIRDQGYHPTLDNIRKCRKELIELSSEHPASSIKTKADFYTTSSVRDLIFHAQEHRFTIPQLKECFDELDLEFLGMYSLDRKMQQQFLSQYSNRKKVY